jgi:hypothetical protein
MSSTVAPKRAAPTMLPTVAPKRAAPTMLPTVAPQASSRCWWGRMPWSTELTTSNRCWWGRLLQLSRLRRSQRVGGVECCVRRSRQRSVLVGSTAAVAVNDGANSVQPVLVGSTAASQLTTEPIATGVGGVNRRGRRSRHERSVLVGSTTSDGANNEQSVLVGSHVVDGAYVTRRSWWEGGRNRVGISTHSPEANACQHPSGRGAGRRRGKLVRGSGEPVELTDEDWSETQGSQGSWQMQRKIGQRLRGARGATWLERSASLAAGAILNSMAAIGGPC